VTYSTSSTGDNRALTFNGQSITYDNNGNMTYGPLNGQMNTYSFDARNELTNAGNTTYTYDAEGNRIGAVENNQTITYVVDPESSLPEVLEKTDPSGKTDYIYGLGLIGQQDPGGYKTYHYDFRGNSVALTDIDGNVTDSYQYDPYGNVAYHSGTTSTPFLYDGRDGVMTDADGLIYMRARYYSPETRRFISRDSVVGSVSDSQTLNSYGYALNNPVNANDPSGKWASEEEEAYAEQHWSKLDVAEMDELGTDYNECSPSDQVNRDIIEREANAIRDKYEPPRLPDYVSITGSYGVIINGKGQLTYARGHLYPLCHNG
jgi:RHS repeat-associated protein